MHQVTYVPGQPLSNHVALLWACAAYGGTRERVLPSGTCELVITLDGDRSPGIVCGAHSEPFVIDAGARPMLIGVHFRPGGAGPFLGVPASEVSNARISLDTLWNSAFDLKEQLLQARTWAARFRILERILQARLRDPPRRHAAVAFALQSIDAAPCMRTIGWLTDRIGLSRRRLIELFSAEVGLTPKLYSRVRRFQRVLSEVEHGEAIDWPDIAQACGYYDQAHFISDFGAFSGLSPTAYVRLRGPQRNHVPLAS